MSDHKPSAPTARNWYSSWVDGTCWPPLWTKLLALPALTLLVACSDGGVFEIPPAEPEPEIGSAIFETPEALGEALFFDTNLSLNRSQACATCHEPERAFTDGRLDDDGLVAAFPLGDDGISRGSRNVPTAAYAALTPEFQFGSHARFNSQQPDYEGYLGGQFLDGRATNLENQAKGPPLNPIEMGLPDERAVMERIEEDPDYVASFKAIYGEDLFDDADAVFDAMAASIAAFERTELFAPFTSKYDKSLTGDYVYAPGSKAALGKALFFSQQFTNCATCHQLAPNSSSGETFTNYEYHNIGTPVNETARLAANIPLDDLDEGLLNNPDVDDPAEVGKYRVPTLRNVAVTGPYMNNGVFRELDTVIRFYDHFLAGSDNDLNPETGAPWREAPFPDTVALEELQDGRAMDQLDIEAMVCFLRTLTDERYENLLPEDELGCEEI